MPIVVQLDLQLARRNLSLTELSERVGITIANLSVLELLSLESQAYAM